MIGICTPYQHSETTASALRLAELALSLSLGVKLLGIGPIRHGVHPHWDNRVRSPHGNGVYLWAKDCDYLVWFDHQPGMLRKARLVAEKATHCLVPMWHYLRRISPAECRQYQRIVCPSRRVYKQFVEHAGDVDSARLTWCQWDSGLPPISRGGPVEPGKLHLYVPLDGSTMDETGLFTVRVIEELLEIVPGLNVTLECAKSWPKKIRRYLHQSSARWGSRFRQHPAESLAGQLDFLHRVDWTFLPSIRTNTAIMASRSLSCNVPVVAYDVPVVSEIVKHGTTGLLIPCELGANWLGAPIAEPKLVSTVQALHTALDGDQPLHQVRRQSWKLMARAKGFFDFWARQWGIEIPG